MADDLELAIGLILGDSELGSAFHKVFEGLEGTAQAGGEKVGEATSKGMKSGLDAGFKRVIEAARAQQKLLLKVVEEGQRQQAAARESAARREAAELTAKERRLATAQQGAWTKRNAQLKADLAARNQAQKAADSRTLVAENEGARQRLAAQRHANRTSEQEVDRKNRTILQAQKGADVLAYAEEQGSQARRTVLLRSFLHATESTWKAGLSAVTNTIKSHLRRREEDQKTENAKELATVESGLRRRETAARLGIERENAIYSRGARQRLDQISRESNRETEVITRAQVRQAEAVQATQAKLNSGLIGAAAGRTSVGAAVRNLALLAGGSFVLRDIYNEAIEAQKIGRDTAAVLKSTGGAAGVQRKEVEALANRLSGLAGIDDEVIQQGLNVLLTFTKIRNVGPDRIFDQAGQAALDLSVRMKGDLQGAIVQVGKALNDPIRGVTALRRVGVSFTKQQQDQIKTLVESGRTLDAQKLILQELKTEFGGAAAANATAAAKFGVTVKNVEETIGTAFLPTVNRVLTFISTLINNIVNGKGAWKIVRDGLLGIAFGLSAIIAAKAAVEVISLAGSAISALSANPVLLGVAALSALSGVLFTVVRNNAAIRGLFSGLVDGFRNWGKVGYLIDKPITGLSTIVRIQSTLGAAARNIHDFFFGLVDGFKNWGKVGYLIDGPIRGLSAIVTIQSSLGAAARVIVDALKTIGGAIADVFKGGSINDASDAISTALSGARDRIKELAPIIVGAVGDLFTAARKAVVSKFGGLFQGALTFVRTGGLGAVKDVIVAAVEVALDAARMTIGDFFGSLFKGIQIPKVDLLTRSGVGESDRSEEASIAQKIGDRLHRIIILVRDQAGDFLGALFTDRKVGSDASAAASLGRRLQGIVKGAFATIGKGFSFLGDLLGKGTEATKPIRDWIGKAFSTIGGLFTEFVLPKLIELPRIIGKFLSSTLFSGPVMRGLLLTAGIVGGVAVAIAFQFVRGFAEGIYKRRDEIASVIHDVLAYAIKTVLGSGNPLIILGAALAAVFVGAKVLGPIGTFIQKLGELRTNARRAAAELQGNTQKSIDLFTQSVGKAELKGKGFGAGITNAAQGIRGTFESARDGVGRFAGFAVGAYSRVAYAARQAQIGPTFRAGLRNLQTAYTNLGTAARTSGRFARSAFDGVRPILAGVAASARTAARGALDFLDATSPRTAAVVRTAVAGIRDAYDDVTTRVGVARTQVGVFARTTTGFAKLAFDGLGASAKKAGSRMLDALDSVSPSAASRVRGAISVVRSAFDGSGSSASSARTKVGDFFKSFGGGAAAAASRAVDGIRNTYTTVGTAIATAKGKVVDFFKSFKTVDTTGLTGGALTSALDQNARAFERRATAAQGVAQVAAGTISGDFIGAADDTATATIGMIGSVANVAVAFASPGGVVLGPLALLSTGIGIIFGEAKKKSDQAKEQAKATAAEVVRISDQFKSSISDQSIKINFDVKSGDGLSTVGRYRAVLGVLHDELANADSAGSKFFKTYRVGFLELTNAFAKGPDAYQKFLRGLASDRTADIFKGNAAAIRLFKDQIDEASKAVADDLQTYSEKAGIANSSTITLSSTTEGLARDLLTGKSTLSEFTDQMKAAGASTEQINFVLKALRTDVFEAITNRLKTEYGSRLPAAIQRTVDEMRAQQIIQREINRENEAAKTPLERLSDAWDRLKQNIQKTADEYKTYLGILDQGKTDLAQARVNIANSAAQAVNLGNQTTADERALAVAQGIEDTETAIAQIRNQSLKDGVFNQGIFNAKVEEFRRKLIEQVLPKLKEQNESLGDAKLSQEQLAKKAADYANTVLLPVLGAEQSITAEKAKQNAATEKAAALTAILLEQARQLADLQRLARGDGAIGSGPHNIGQTHFAVGGIVRRPTNALVGEAGPEVIIPLNDARRAAELLRLSGLERIAGVNASANAASIPTQAGSVTGGTTVALDPSDAVREYLRAVAEGIKKGMVLTEDGTLVPQSFYDGTTEAVKSYLHAVADGVKNGMVLTEDGSLVPQSFYDTTGDGVKNYLHAVAEGVKGGMHLAEDGSLVPASFYDDTKTAIEDTTRVAVSAYLHAMLAAVRASFTFKGVAHGGNLGEKAMAVGGIVRRPTRALIGEAGPEVVIPLNDARRAAELLRQSGLSSINSSRPFDGSPASAPLTTKLGGALPGVPITVTVITKPTKGAADDAVLTYLRALRQQADALKGIAMLSKVDPAAKAFFEFMRGQAKSVFDYMAKRATLAGPQGSGVRFTPPPRPVTGPVRPATGVSFTPTELNRLATPQPRSTPVTDPELAARLDRLIGSLEGQGVLNGDNYDIKIEGQTEPVATAHEVARQLQVAKYLKVAPTNRGVLSVSR